MRRTVRTAVAPSVVRSPTVTTSLPDRVQADLLVARKARDEHAVTALRTLLAAFSNAEAPPAPADVVARAAR